MTSSPDLAALLVRVEKAEHGSMNLDIAVMDAAWPGWGVHPDERDHFITSSLDAALALCERVLPDGWNWDIGSDFDGLGKFYCGQVWSARYDTYGQPCISRASPALALLAAMLRALLALAGDTSGGGGEIDVSACADSSDAPRFAAAGEAQRKSERQS